MPRLGLPAYTWWQEALHGVADSPGVNFSDSGPFSVATSFPQPILMGAAFDDQLITDVATVISTEARAFNNDNRAGLDYWTPNIVRDHFRYTRGPEIYVDRLSLRTHLRTQDGVEVKVRFSR